MLRRRTCRGTQVPDDLGSPREGLAGLHQQDCSCWPRHWWTQRKSGGGAGSRVPRWKEPDRVG
eukprot:5562555-Pyramimonas_sp.AAC.1